MGFNYYSIHPIARYNPMKYLSLFTIILSLLFSSCGDSGGSGDGSVTTSGASTPSSLPSGLVIAVNPKITFTASLSDGGTVAVSYENDGGDYPVYSGNVDVTMNKTGSQITLTFDFSAALPGTTLSMVLDGFTDRGGDGHTDEFTVTATIDGDTKPASTGQFVGGVKPTNENIPASQRVDISGTPTEQQFQNYLVGFAILVTDTTDDDTAFIHFIDQTSVEFYDDDGEISRGTYTYSYNGGNPTLLISDMTESDGDVWSSNVSLSFDSFYKGNWQNLEHIWNGTNDPDLGREVFLCFLERASKICSIC